MLKKDYMLARTSFLVTVISMTLLSLSLCFIPYTSEKQNVINYILSGVIWITFLATLISSFFAGKILKKFRSKLVKMNVIKYQKFPGIINFSFSKINIAIYVCIFVGTIISITDMKFSYVPEKVMFPILALTVMAFTVHCIIDGKNYKVYKVIKEIMKRDAKH